MQLSEFKDLTIKAELGITAEFGRILSLVDYGNVDYWYDSDRFSADGEILKEDEKLNVGIEKLKDFCDIFSIKTKFYYGMDSKNKGSIHHISLARDAFGKSNVSTKEIQHIRHYLNDSEKKGNTRSVTYDTAGAYVSIPKCNFDVEICVDAIRLMDSYDTLCLFSSDADFIALFRFLKYKKKKIILIKGGHALHDLILQSNLVIKAQDIKKNLVFIKQKSRR